MVNTSWIFTFIEWSFSFSFGQIECVLKAENWPRIAVKNDIIIVFRLTWYALFCKPFSSFNSDVYQYHTGRFTGKSLTRNVTKAFMYILMNVEMPDTAQMISLILTGFLLEILVKRNYLKGSSGNIAMHFTLTQDFTHDIMCQLLVLLLFLDLVLFFLCCMSDDIYAHVGYSFSLV